MVGPMLVSRFYVRQKITLMVNRYQIFGADPDGSEGPLLAFAQQKPRARDVWLNVVAGTTATVVDTLRAPHLDFTRSELSRENTPPRTTDT